MRLYDGDGTQRSSARLPRVGLMMLLTASAGAAPATAEQAPAHRQPAPSSIRFSDVTEQLGVDYVHSAGRSAGHQLPETMGGGIAWLDYDIDGRQDLYFVDSGVLPGIQPLQPPAPGAGSNRLYRHGASGGYAQVYSGLEQPGYGMGVAVGDYDGDGWPDVFVTNFGANALFRNNGDGSFANVTARYALDDSRWSTSAAWTDLDLDGFPELYVVNYVHYEIPNSRLCRDRGDRLIYCTPELFNGVADALYHNMGGRGFDDITLAAGVQNAAEGKGLAIVSADIDSDGLPDIYVANDTTRNFLYLNHGGLQFEDAGLVSGAGVNAEGYPQSGMGVDIADLDGDGVPEIGVTNFDQQAVNLFQALVPGLFQDRTFESGMGEATARTLGFGIAFFDADGDGDQDIVLANGHLHFDADSGQPNQVFRNLSLDLRGNPNSQAPPLQEVTDLAGAAMQRLRVSRGIAAGDLDGDAWPDIVVTNVGGPAELLRNDSLRQAHRLVLRLRGYGTNRDGFGAALEITPIRASGPGAVQYFQVKSSSSYLSQRANEIYAGIGDAERAVATVIWPGGQREELGELPADSISIVIEGRGVIATRSAAERP